MNKDENLIYILKFHTCPVNSLAVSNDNSLLLSSSSQFVDYYDRIVFSDNKICLWNLKTGKKINAWNAHDFEYNESGKIFVNFFNNNYAISTGPDSKIKIWDLKKFKEKIVYSTNEHKIESMKLLKTKLLLITGGNYRDKSIRLWNLNNGNCLTILNNHKWSVDSVDITHNANNAVSSSNLHDEKPITIWDLHKEKNINSFGNKEMRITKVKFLTKKYIISSGEDKIIRIWNIDTGKIIRFFKGHEGYPTCFKEFSNKKTFISGNNSIIKNQENHVYFWNIAKGELKNKTFIHESGINTLEISPDNKKIITGCNNGNIYVWKK